MSEKKFITDSPKVNFFFGLIIGVAVVSLAGFSLMASGFLKQDKAKTAVENTEQQVAGEEQKPAQPSVDLKISDQDHLLGDKNAPVKIFTFSDFQCPYCARHHITMHQIVDEYEDKVAWIYKQFPIASHPLGMPGAIASECAGEQGKFWQMADKIFANQESLTADSFEKFVKDLGLDMEQYKTCVGEERPKDKILADYNLGIESGVQGTPSNFINNQMIPGAVPYENVKEIIDSLLK